MKFFLRIEFVLVLVLSSILQLGCSKELSFIEGEWTIKHIQIYNELLPHYFSWNIITFYQNWDLLPPAEFDKPRNKGKWEIEQSSERFIVGLYSQGSIVNGVYEVKFWNDSLENGIIIYHAEFSNESLSFLLQRQNWIP